MDYMMKARAASGLRAPTFTSTSRMTGTYSHNIASPLTYYPPWPPGLPSPPATLLRTRYPSHPGPGSRPRPSLDLLHCAGPRGQHNRTIVPVRLRQPVPACRTFSWQDLQTIGSSPNYCHH